MRTLILATSALHFIDAILLAERFEEPHLVLSGYHKARAEMFLSWLAKLEQPIFKTTRYQFMRTSRQTRPVIASIQPQQIITGNDDIREFQVLTYIAKRHAKQRGYDVQFAYMDDGLSTYRQRPAVINRLHHTRNAVRWLTKGYTRDRRQKIAHSQDLSTRYLFSPDEFPTKDHVTNEQIIISELARARLKQLASIAMNDVYLPEKADLVLLPNEKSVLEDDDFLPKIEAIIAKTQQTGRALILKSHPSDSHHLAKPLANNDKVIYIEQRIPAELLLGAISPEKIYSGQSTITMTAALLYPDIKLYPIS